MKKFYLFIFLLLVFTNSVFAQKQTRKKTTFQKNKISTENSSENKMDSSNSNQNAESANIDSPVKILYKPRAAYPQPFDGGTVCMQGTVTLRVQFLETGKIGEIKVISGLPYGANENAIEAAKKIKFEPAIKNGKPITTVKIVLFTFTIY